MKTTAVKEGNYYIVNGAKKWITGAGKANAFITAVRTGPPNSGQKGLSMLLIDANLQGFSKRRMDTTGGEPVYYLVFENVKVPEI